MSSLVGGGSLQGFKDEVVGCRWVVVRDSGAAVRRGRWDCSRPFNRKGLRPAFQVWPCLVRTTAHLPALSTAGC